MVRTRIAPSPTGEDLHIGNLYTALFNWAFAKKNKGKFVVRSEDTDRKRLVEGSEQQILKTLKRYGLTYDEGVDVGGPYAPYRQSERLALYKKYAGELVVKGHAYYCTCSSDRLEKLREEQTAKKIPTGYDKHCLALQEEVKRDIEEGKTFVIRLNVPVNIDITVTDIIRGEIVINSNTFDDQVLIKSDGFPTYHLAVVVDDHLMEISHVIRGEEWISSTPKHILLYDFLEWEKPVYAHVPLLRNADTSKLSKRKNPVWSGWYLDEGFLPEAVLNFLALMGWSHPQGKEIFSLEEFAEVVDLARLSTVGPVFDKQKLLWMNGEYIRAMRQEELVERLFVFYRGTYDKGFIAKSVPLIQERIKTLKEFDEYCRFFIGIPKNFEQDTLQDKELIKKIHDVLESIPVDLWNIETINTTLQSLAEKEGISFSKFFMLIRLVITGKKITPPINESLVILGKDETLHRLV